jgi:hypothetical protein
MNTPNFCRLCACCGRMLALRRFRFERAGVFGGVCLVCIRHRRALTGGIPCPVTGREVLPEKFSPFAVGLGSPVGVSAQPKLREANAPKKCAAPSKTDRRLATIR